jgi:hypothetical protein
MGYDPKATLIKKEIKTLANGDKFFLKLMKHAIQAETQSKNRRFSDPATSQKSNKSTQNSD